MSTHRNTRFLQLSFGVCSLLITIALGKLPAQAEESIHIRQLLETNQCVGCDLAGADLRGANLRGANLQGANLEGANFFRANLDGANLVNANLQKANFSYASLQEAVLNEANLDQTHLIAANFRNATLVETSLRSALLEETDLAEPYWLRPILRMLFLSAPILQKRRFAGPSSGTDYPIIGGVISNFRFHVLCFGSF